MFVLAIDTSSPAVTAAVIELAGTDARVVAEHAPVAARGHGELLTPAVAACLDDAGLRPAGIDAVVAGAGPGPYTGLRVGLTTAAAFADALGLPTYGVCSLDAIGAAYPDEPALLVATDARRREVYWARYANGARVGEPAVARPADVPAGDASAAAGAGAHLYPDAWPHLPRRAEQHPPAVRLVQLAVERLLDRSPSEPLTPRYLRRPDAVVPGAPKAVRQ